MSLIPDLELLISLLGTDIVGYSCACSTAEIEAHVSESAPLGAEVATAVERLLRVASPLMAEERDRLDRPQVPLTADSVRRSQRRRLARLAEYVPAEDTSRANALRRQAGGDLTDCVRDGDDVLTALKRIAHDTFPLFLMIPEESDWGSDVLRSEILRAHPGVDELAAAVIPPDALSRLFPDAKRDGVSVRIRSSRGVSHNVRLAELADRLLLGAARRVGWGPGLGESVFLKAVAAEVDELRQLAIGREVQVPARVGLGPLDVDAGFSVRTPFGELSAVVAPEGAASPGTSQAAVVLDTTVPLVTHVDDDEEAQAASSTAYRRAQAELDHRVTGVRLAVVLAMRRKMPVALSEQDREIFDPLAPAIYGGGRGRPFLGSPVGHEDVDEIVRWTELVHRHRHPAIDAAVARLLRSVEWVRESDDAIVDAVICLEALFQRGSEIGFRVASAVAHLLGETADQRAEYSRRVQALYKARSKYVHGGSTARLDTEAHLLRFDAMHLAIDVMRQLFEHRPELIPDRRRGERLTLALDSGSTAIATERAPEARVDIDDGRD